MMSADEAYAYIRSTQSYGSRPGLERVERLCSLLGSPQDKLSVVHVAGTNGKGSTCSMLASILRAAGYRSGLFLSPYLEDYRDSLLVNGEMISMEAFADVLSEVKEKAERMADDPPTEFEILTAAAFLWFYKSGCGAAVLETGMGGRLDATNILKKPAASVITSISIDHTAYLGETEEEIAREKCGIIKPDGLVVCAPRQKPSVRAIIAEYAAKMNSRIAESDMDACVFGASGLDGTELRYRGLSLHVPLAGRHQALNALTAVETAMALREAGSFAIPDGAIETGIADTRIAARQEVMCRKPFVLLDGAHNAEGIRALLATLMENLPGRRIVAVMGMLRDKEYEMCIAGIASLCAALIAVKPESPRALTAEETAAVAAKYCRRVSAPGDYASALKDALREAGEDGAVVVCGSLYLAGPMRALLKKMLCI
jgi:dihydrofolate synthase/folylpolyglutamate synthase